MKPNVAMTESDTRYKGVQDRVSKWNHFRCLTSIDDGSVAVLDMKGILLHSRMELHNQMRLQHGWMTVESPL